MSELERMERLIVRSLDGEITSDEQNELNRAMLRNPEIRRLRDGYAAVDELSAAALADGSAGREIDLDAVFEASAPARSRWRFHRGWLMIPGAAAAALLALVIPEPGFRGERAPQIPIQAGSVPFSGWNGEFAQPVSSIPRVRSNTGREVIGVVGDDGNLYWIEVERTRTVRWPAGAEQRIRASDSL